MYDQLLFSSFPQRHLSLVSTRAIRKSHYLACNQKHQLHHLPNLADVILPHSVSNVGPSKGRLKGCFQTSASQARILLYTCPSCSYGPFSKSEFSFQYTLRIPVGLNSILQIIRWSDVWSNHCPMILLQGGILNMLKFFFICQQRYVDI